ncbi:MAG TPA: hypothetical protein VKA53_06370, partial [Thermoanaerobaculia bacterium]|nr:hypothetical protein [Thermoanaerobaculia bacterium]
GRTTPRRELRVPDAMLEFGGPSLVHTREKFLPLWESTTYPPRAKGTSMLHGHVDSENNVFGLAPLGTGAQR